MRSPSPPRPRRLARTEEEKDAWVDAAAVRPQAILGGLDGVRTLRRRRPPSPTSPRPAEPQSVEPEPPLPPIQHEAEAPLRGPTDTFANLKANVHKNGTRVDSIMLRSNTLELSHVGTTSVTKPKIADRRLKELKDDMLLVIGMLGDLDWNPFPIHFAKLLGIFKVMSVGKEAVWLRVRWRVLRAGSPPTGPFLSGHYGHTENVPLYGEDKEDIDFLNWIEEGSAKKHLTKNQLMSKALVSFICNHPRLSVIMPRLTPDRVWAFPPSPASRPVEGQPSFKKKQRTKEPVQT